MGFVKAMEGMNDPIGEYMFSLGRRVDKLERDLARLEDQPHPRSTGELQR